MKYLVFIKDAYVRDCQAFLGMKIPSSDDFDLFDETFDDGWRDVSGKIAVAEYTGLTKDEVMERISLGYPQATGAFPSLLDTLSRLDGLGLSGAALSALGGRPLRAPADLSAF